MNNIDKAKILEKLIFHHEQLVVELNKTIQDLSLEADLPEGETVDLEDASHQNLSSDMKQHYEALVANSQRDLDKLRSYIDIPMDTIGPGALVVTDHVMFFIGVATPKLHLKDYPVLVGISTDSDIFKVLQNKNTGDLFHFDGQMLRIKNIL